MSDFEYLSVLISIVIGLGLTHLLSGMGRALHFRRRNPIDAVHMAWSLGVFLTLVLNWWVSLMWRDYASWNFGVFLLLILWTTSLYMLTLALYPPSLPEDVDYHALFDENRSWFMLTLAVMLVLDVVIFFLREEEMPTLVYISYVGHYLLLTLVAFVVKHRVYDKLFAWYFLASMLAWSFGVRITLDVF